LVLYLDKKTLEIYDTSKVDSLTTKVGYLFGSIFYLSRDAKSP